MKKLKFWKGVGGYFGAVKLRGRWHYIGHEGWEMIEFHKWHQDNGIPVERVQGDPGPIVELYKKYGNTWAAIKNHLPYWKDGVEESNKNEK